MMKNRFLFFSVLAISFCQLTGCTTSPPRNQENVCEIFREKDDWYDYSKESFEKWGVPIHLQMAFVYQESRFVADAQPPREWLLGFIPWFRPSSAYGYSQAKDSTWDWYQDKTGNWGADRDDFSDTTDFIGWYCTISHKKLGISKWDAKKQYLAYHEGHGGYQRGTYHNKPWLINVSNKVSARAKKYRAQLASCREELESSGWFFW